MAFMSQSQHQYQTNNNNPVGSGCLTFDCGTRIGCQINTISQNISSQHQWAQNYARLHREIEIELICAPSQYSDSFWRQQLSNVYHGAVSQYKTNPILEFNNDSIRLYGFYVRSLNLDVNNNIKIDAACDYYELDSITPQEEVRIIREKKLKRILND
jgi:hypothetical protein